MKLLDESVSLSPAKVRIFWGLWIALTLFHTLPVLLFEHLPMQDLPNHLAMIATLLRKNTDPSWGEHFVDRLKIQPQATFYFVGWILSKQLGVMAAGKVLLLAYIALTPLAFRLVLSALEIRNPWAAFAIFPMLFSDSYLVGLLPWLIALPLALSFVALSIYLTRRSELSLPGLIFLSGLGVLVWLTHPMAAMVSIVTLVAILPLQGKLRRILATLAALLPATLLTVGGVLAMPGIGQPGMDAPDLEFSTIDKVKYLGITPLVMAEATRSPVFWLALVSLWIVVGIAVFRTVQQVQLKSRQIIALRSSQELEEPSVSDSGGPQEVLVWEALQGTAMFGVLALVLVYVALPFGQGPVVWLDARIASWVWLILLLALGRWVAIERMGQIAMGVLILSSWWCIFQGHRTFSEEIAPLFQVLEKAPNGGRLLLLPENRESDAFRPFYVRSKDIPCFSLYVHTGSYYHVAHGGESPYMTFHDSLDWVPLGLKEPRFHQMSITGTFMPVATLRSVTALGLTFDLILVRGRGELSRRLTVLGPPIAASGEWVLYPGKNLDGNQILAPR